MRQFEVPAVGRATKEATHEAGLRIGIVLLDKFTLTAFSGFIDALRLAADYGGQSRPIHASWTVMTPGDAPQRASCGVYVSPTSPLIDASNFHYVAVCGGNNRTGSGIPNAVLRYLRDAARQKVRIVGLCTGTFAIAEAGLIKNRACVHWNVADEFSERFPHLSVCTDKIFVREGDIITCAGSTAAIDVALHLIDLHCGRDKALQAVRHMMLLDMRPPTVPQAHFSTELIRTNDPRVHRAVQFMEQRLNCPPTLEEISDDVGISVRQLSRLFSIHLKMTPAKFQKYLSLKYAYWMLSHSSSSVTKIAVDAGFSDAAHLSRDFRRQFGKSPTAFRSQISRDRDPSLSAAP